MIPGSGYYVGQCALTTDGSTLTVACDNGSSYPNEITPHLYELPSLDLIGECDYGSSLQRQFFAADTPPDDSLRQHVDIPSQMSFSPGGARLAVASCGDLYAIKFQP